MKHIEGRAFLKLDGLLVRVVSQPTITVRNTGDASLATIYATNSVHASQVKGNPFTGDTSGGYDYYIPDTRYNEEISGGTPVLGSTLVSSDNIAFDPYTHFAFSNLNSGYVLQQNSAGVFAPVAVGSLGLVLAGQDYVQLTGVSCGNPRLQYNPTSGVPVLDVVMTGTGWVQAWRTSSGHGGAATDVAVLDGLGVLFTRGFRAHSGSAVAPSIHNSEAQRAGLYFPGVNVPALTASGGALTAALDAASGFVLSGKTFIGNACGLTTSSAIITASKAIAAADFGVTQVCSTTTNITITVSQGTGTPGQVLPIFRAGAGTVTVTSGGAVTILGKQFTVNSLSGASLECIAANVWLFRV